MWFDQQSYDVRCEWGARGVEVLAPHVDAVIIVDVLSFSTCVDVALGRGAIVHPYRWKDESARQHAEKVGAVLAGPRSRDSVSLSPASLLALPPGASIVLPSPNGATLSSLTGSTPTLTGCLRNARAVARRAMRFGPRIGVVPAGERWPDGSLRPSLEDWLGAGAIVEHLDGSRSPEADAARLALDAHRSWIGAVVRECASGRELIDGGWQSDVEIAIELDVSAAAPLLVDGAYRADV